MFYYYHAESGCVWKQLTQLTYIELEEEISKENYEQLILELGIMNDNYLALQLQVFKEISEIKGKGAAAKKAELLKTQYNEAIELMLVTAFDPAINTHIKSINIHDEPTETPYTLDYIIKKITSVRALTKEMKKEVEDFVNAQTFELELKKILVKVLTKKLSIGIAPKGINKALGKVLFDTTEYMKAEDDISIVQEWFNKGIKSIAEIKYDGIRCIAKFQNKQLVKMETYNKSIIDMVPLIHIVPQLNEYAKHWPFDMGLEFFLDFEITSKDRQSVSGEVNKVLQGTAKPGIDEKWLVNMFDIHTTDICDGETLSKVSYTNRRKVISYMYDQIALARIDTPNLRLAQAVDLQNMDHVQSLFESVVSKGEEGLMIKRIDGVYEMKRSKNWVKMKSEKECELKVESWFKGDGKRTETIGGFVFSSEDKRIKVNVGGGFKDSDLAEIMKYGPDSYIGKIATIRYNEVISREGMDIKSLFLPRFIVWRFDKSIADTLDKIK